MRILYVITELYEGGAENSLYRTAIKLYKNGHDLQVVCLFGGEGIIAKKLEKAGIKVVSLEITTVKQILKGRHLKELISNFKPDVVHSWLFHANFLAALFTPKKVPLCIGVRVLEPRRSHKMLSRIRKSNINKVFCVSPTVKDYVVNDLKFSSSSTKYIGNGINIEDYIECFNSIRDNGEVHGLCIARKVEQKGLDILIEALSKIPRENKWSWTFIGDAPDKEYDQLLKKKIVDGGIQERINWLGALNRKEVKKYLSSVDLLALPSRWEGQANVVLEAMASGVPVIASENSGYEKGVPIIVVENTPENWFESLQQFFEAPSKYSKLKNEAYEWVKSRSWQSIAEQYEEEYQKLIT